MKNLMVVLAVLGLLFVSIEAKAAEVQFKIKKELVSALTENRGMNVRTFSKEELREFFVPVFSSERARENFFNSIDARLSKKRGAMILVLFRESGLLHAGPMLVFEMEQGDHLHRIQILSDGVVSYEETDSEEEQRKMATPTQIGANLVRPVAN